MSDILNTDEDSNVVDLHENRIQELKNAARRGEIAAMFAGNELLEEYFNNAKNQLVDALINTSAGQDMERYRLQVALQVLDRMRGFMNKIVEQGEFSQKQLREISKPNRNKFF